MQQLGGTLLVDEAVGFRDTETTSEVDVTAEVVGPPDVRQRMLVAAVVNSVVAIYLRLESRNLMSGDLRTLWQNLRPNLFLAEPAPPDSAP